MWMLDSCANSRDVKKKLLELYDELFSHEGFADLRLEIRILRRGQKEVIIHCGKQYRYVLDYRAARHEGESEGAYSGRERRSGRDRRCNQGGYDGIERRKGPRRRNDR
jgi:hypothetical protein